ncbi:MULTISPECIES: TonB-dependent receptor [Aliiglaciecola]|uniref:TonB-dependent receptor n=1 Tax=Aliiglaciecola TaxID=1406885 RepID=UPI001C086720|nr:MULTISPECIES: TonB-dependent receptor [Aliiglaciecola]MBU2878240.1 TonB-dependent receptor [Aliiglaciecola lipolytica]MDO6711849.1 TonB-dependent receptor [Aliiglaciecola sp. 2_MG-2023]MDO6752977.1 TonB-dependent receptor [Aliiglaciecola sp. 1_MG-2023]
MSRTNVTPRASKFSKVSTAVILGLLSSASANLYAQESSEGDVEAITIKGVRGSLLKSLNQKRFANKVVDVITAEDIGKFPEANLSEAIQRVPGVTLNRNPTGEGTAINLRGLGPEFTSTEVNGMLAGGSDGTRGFSFEIFPAELFNSVEISKSVTADQVEGGIAGSVSLYTPDPLATKDQVLNVSVYNNYSDNTGTNSPKASVVFNQNWDDTFGINAALVYSDTDMQNNEVRGSSHSPLSAVWTGPDVGEEGGPTQEQLDALYPRIESFGYTSEERETLGAVLGLQWRPNDDLDIKARALVGKIDGDRVETILDAPSESNITAVSNTVIENGIATQATLTGVQQRVGARQEAIDEEVNQFTLSADWHISDSLKFSPYIGHFSREKTNSNDLFSFRRMEEDGNFYPADVSYIMRDNYLEWSTPDTDFASNPEEFVVNVFIRRPLETKDSNNTLKLDFEYDNGDLMKVDFGLRFTDRELEQHQTRSDIRAESFLADGVTPLNRRTDLPTLADVYTPLDRFNVDGAGFAPSTLIGGDPAQILSTFFNADGSPIDGLYEDVNEPFELINSFELQEQTIAAYAQANIEVSESVTLSTGLRFVRTIQTIDSQVTTDSSDVNAFSPVTLKSDYQEILPNMNVRYALNDDMVVRAAYFKSLTRPALGELAAFESFNGIDEGGGLGSRGNPDLQPFTADNYDIGFEWYFTSEAVAAINIFYKDLDGFIDTSSTTEIREFPRQSDGVIVSGPIIFTQPANGVGATITGIELAYQSRLGFISESLDDFGLLANYTMIDSAAQYSDEGDVRNSGLPGLSESSYNLALYYDVPSFNARLSYTWRDEYLVEFASTAGIPQWQEEYGQLDFSASYNVTDALQIQVQGLNLLTEQEVNRSVQNTPYDLAQIDRRFVIGARYSF